MLDLLLELLLELLLLLLLPLHRYYRVRGSSSNGSSRSSSSSSSSRSSRRSSTSHVTHVKQMYWGPVGVKNVVGVNFWGENPVVPAAGKCCKLDTHEHHFCRKKKMDRNDDMPRSCQGRPRGSLRTTQAQPPAQPFLTRVHSPLLGAQPAHNLLDRTTSCKC